MRIGQRDYELTIKLQGGALAQFIRSGDIRDLSLAIEVALGGADALLLELDALETLLISRGREAAARTMRKMEVELTLHQWARRAIAIDILLATDAALDDTIEHALGLGDAGTAA